MNARSRIKAQCRESTDGYEIMICIQHRTAVDWSWVCIRYRANADIIASPSTVIKDFGNPQRYTWDEIATWLENYLAEHPGTGFWEP